MQPVHVASHLVAGLFSIYRVHGVDAEIITAEKPPGEGNADGEGAVKRVHRHAKSAIMQVSLHSSLAYLLLRALSLEARCGLCTSLDGNIMPFLMRMISDALKSPFLFRGKLLVCDAFNVICYRTNR